MFLKYTAQQLKFSLVDNNEQAELESYRSSQQDREYQFWERRPFKATMLARMGDEQAISTIMNRVQRIPVSDDVGYQLFPDLVYTRARPILNYLIELYCIVRDKLAN